MLKKQNTPRKRPGLVGSSILPTKPRSAKPDHKPGAKKRDKYKRDKEGKFA